MILADFVLTILCGVIIGASVFMLGFHEGRRREYIKRPQITLTLDMERVKKFNADVSGPEPVDFLRAAFHHDINVERKGEPDGEPR